MPLPHLLLSHASTCQAHGPDRQLVFRQLSSASHLMNISTLSYCDHLYIKLPLADAHSLLHSPLGFAFISSSGEHLLDLAWLGFFDENLKERESKNGLEVTPGRTAQHGCKALATCALAL